MLKDLIGWDDFGEQQRRAAEDGRLLGIGLGCYVEGTGPGPYEGAHVQVLTDGTVEVAIGLTSQGQGHQTVFAQIVADELGVPFDSVRVTTGDTRRFGYAVGTFASRAAVMSGSAVALAARAARTKALRVAADALECDPADLDIADGVVSMKGNPTASIPLGQVAVLSNPLRYAFDEAAQGRHPVRPARRSRQAAGGRRRRARPGGQGLLLPAAVDVRLRHARRDRRDRPGHQRDRDRASTASCTTAAT